MVTQPFDTTDVGKCERLTRHFKDKKGWSGGVTYHDMYGHYVDDPHESVTSEERTRRPAQCEVYGNNKELQEKLEGNNKQGGVWATAFSVILEKNAIVKTDIPVNLASCNTKKEMRLEHFDALERMPKTCEVESIHAHNQRDVNPAFHIHIKCSNATSETIEWLREVIEQSGEIGEKMCTGISKQDLEFMR